MVASLLRIMGGLLKRLPEAHRETKAHLEPLFLSAAAWAFGGAAAGDEAGVDSRLALDVAWRQCFKDHGGVTWPSEGVVWDYFASPLPPDAKRGFETHVQGPPPPSPGHGWRSWATAVGAYVPAGELYFGEIHVPTVDGTRIGALLALLEVLAPPRHVRREMRGGLRGGRYPLTFQCVLCVGGELSGAFGWRNWGGEDGGGGGLAAGGGGPKRSQKCERVSQLFHRRAALASAAGGTPRAPRRAGTFILGRGTERWAFHRVS